MLKKIVKIIAPIFLAAFATTALAIDQNTLEPLENFPRTQLSIATPDARLHHFEIWIADTPSRREQGLMFVKSLRDTQGMLFVYPTPELISMWMKNTLIPLDMLFIRADGRVARIETNAKPLSLRIIESKENVTGVIELNGGAAQRLNIKAGAIVMYPSFGTSIAR